MKKIDRTQLFCMAIGKGELLVIVQGGSGLGTIIFTTTQQILSSKRVRD
jgi:hypothetical protein